MKTTKFEHDLAIVIIKGIFRIFISALEGAAPPPIPCVPIPIRCATFVAIPGAALANPFFATIAGWAYGWCGGWSCLGGG